MIFKDVLITNEGKRLFDIVAAGEGAITWGYCGLYNQNINSISEAQVASITEFTGDIVAKGAATAVFNEDSGTATITCQMDNTDESCGGGNAWSFGLWATVNDETKLVIVARTGGFEPTPIPSSETLPDGRFVGILKLSVEMSSTTAAAILSTGMYALADDLQREIQIRHDFDLELQNRIETEIGRAVLKTGDQDIDGDKTFLQPVTSPVFIGDLRGLIPYPTTTQSASIEIPVGGITIVKVHSVRLSQITLDYGTQVGSTAQVLPGIEYFATQIAEFPLSFDSMSSEISLAANQHFVLLQPCIINENKVGYALAMRIS